MDRIKQELKYYKIDEDMLSALLYDSTMLELMFEDGGYPRDKVDEGIYKTDDGICVDLNKTVELNMREYQLID